MLKTALLGIVTVIIAMAMNQGKAEFATFVSFTGSILIAWVAIQLLQGIMGSFERLLPEEMEYVTLLTKMIGVTYISEFASSLCRDAGYSTVAGQIELVGKLSILTIGMPIVLALFELMTTLV